MNSNVYYIKTEKLEAWWNEDFHKSLMNHQKVKESHDSKKKKKRTDI